MGFLFNQACFSTNAEAADAFFLSQGPFLTSGSTSYLSWFEKSGATWQVKRQSISTNGTVTVLASSTATVPTFPACTQSQTFMDGMALGWGVAAAMVAAYAVKFIGRALNR